MSDESKTAAEPTEAPRTDGYIDGETALLHLRGIRAILGRLASSANLAGDDDEDLMFGFLEHAMAEQIETLTDVLGVR